MSKIDFGVVRPIKGDTDMIRKEKPISKYASYSKEELKDMLSKAIEEYGKAVDAMDPENLETWYILDDLRSEMMTILKEWLSR